MPNIKVNGQVSTVANDKFHYLKLWETYDFKGEPRHRLWTAWLDRDLNINEGDFIEVTGDLSTKVGTYNKPGEEAKSVVEHSLNNCTINLVKAAEPKGTQVRNASDILTQKDSTAEVDMPF